VTTAATADGPVPILVVPEGAPRKRRLGRRILAIVAAVLALALIVGAIFVWRTIRGPLPQTSGTAALPGLTANVQVLRDGIGVPHIYADTADDLFRAQGYVHAQDRFFEMDMRRHVTAGRMAELVGAVPAAIDADRVIRTFGWRRVAEQEWDLMSPQTQQWLAAYAEGVNAYISGRSPRSLGMEYAVLGLQVPVSAPEPWTPVDSLAWLKALAWDLRTNYGTELDRANVYASLGDVGLVNELFPPSQASGAVPIVNPNDPVGAATLAAGAAAAGVLPNTGQGLFSPAQNTSPFAQSDSVGNAMAAAQTALNAVPRLLAPGEGLGSNSWVVSGRYTASGLPMLANDPHLGLEAPGIFTQTGLHCNAITDVCPFDVVGYSFAGFPGIIIGHNDQLAWGITNMGPDVTDFFVEEISGDTHLRDGEWLPLDVRTEQILVAGGEPIDLVIRMVGDRPIISDVLPVMGAADAPATTPRDAEGGQVAVSLQWTALTPGLSMEAIFTIDLAHNAADVARAGGYFEVPAQALVFATVQGDIGFQAPGRIPIRAEVPSAPVPTDGTWPRDGRDSRYEWQGFIPSADLPAMLNPDEGFIVAANQAVLPLNGQPDMGMDFDYGARSERIRDMLEEQIASGVPFTVADFHRMITDVHDPTADLLVPALLATHEGLIDPSPNAAALDLLRNWDHRMDADSPAAAYFGAVWAQVMAMTLRDDLPDTSWPNSRSRWVTVFRDLLADPTNEFWDNRDTPQVETRDDILREALTAARLDLTERFSANPASWRWGQMHLLELQHPVLGGAGIPGFVRNFVNPPAQEVSGSTVTVVASGWDANQDRFTVRTGQAIRIIDDVGNWDNSTWCNVTGVSGHPASDHYSDQLEAWANQGSFPMWFTRPAVAAATQQTLTLTP